jgi:hypothetical protein
LHVLWYHRKTNWKAFVYTNGMRGVAYQRN